MATVDVNGRQIRLISDLGSEGEVSMSRSYNSAYDAERFSHWEEVKAKRIKELADGTSVPDRIEEWTNGRDFYVYMGNLLLYEAHEDRWVAYAPYKYRWVFWFYTDTLEKAKEEIKENIRRNIDGIV